ncbi:MAG TPA: hypothetical protein VMH87_12810 [Pseudomonadales bacterium]|nr:hypothetical protein [Pseudomonadales bacterium]
MKLSIWNIYLRDDVVYVPTVAQAESGGHLGYFMDIDPVKVVSATDTEALQDAVIEAMRKGNPIVPAPTRATFPEPVLLKYAKTKSWSAFEKNTLVWTISEKDGNYEIKPKRRRADRGWEDDPTKSEVLPPGTTLNVVAQRLASLVYRAAEE